MRITRDTAWAAAATAVGAVLRIVSPGNGSLSHDEALFMLLVRLPTLGDMIEVLRVHEFHPPLFYLLMRGWVLLAGVEAASVLPVVAAVALIPLVYRVAARGSNGAAGVIAAWVVAVSPALVFFSPQLRPYSIFMVAAVGSCALFWQLSSGTRKSWLGYVACTLAMLLTHNWGWIILAAQAVLGALIPQLFQRRVSPPDPRRIGAAWLAVGLGFLPWLPSFVDQALYRGYPPQRVDLMRAIFELPRSVFGPAVAPWGFLLLGVLLLVPVLVRSKAAEAGKLFALGFVPFVCIAIAAPLSHKSALLLPHTVASLIPFIAMLIGAAIVTLWQSNWRAPAVLVSLVAGVLITSDLAARLRLQKGNAESVARQVAGHARGDDVIVVAPEWLITSFNHYFRLPNRQIVYPEFSREEMVPYERTYTPLIEPAPMRAAADTIAALSRRGGRVWLVTVRDGPADSVGQGQMTLPDTFDVYEVGAIRGNQLKHELTRWFGAPDTAIVTPDSRPGIEMMRAMLFD